MTTRDQHIDATIHITTPESISFRYRVAGPFRRLPAFIVDFVLRVGLLIGLLFFLMIVAGTTQLISFEVSVGLFIIVYFVLDWLYGGLLETYWNGQTVGKRVMGIRVLTVDGQPITGLQAMARNFLRFADMMPTIPGIALVQEPSPIGVPTFMLGLVAILLNRRFQRLGDLVAGTMVVIDEQKALNTPTMFSDERVAQLAAELPASFHVETSLARCLASYVQRRQLFSAARRREIARHVAAPLIRQFHLPPDTNFDLLLCALFYRTFVSDLNEEVAVPGTFEEANQVATPVVNPGFDLPNHVPTPESSSTKAADSQ